MNCTVGYMRLAKSVDQQYMACPHCPKLHIYSSYTNELMIIGSICGGFDVKVMKICRIPATRM